MRDASFRLRRTLLPTGPLLLLLALVALVGGCGPGRDDLAPPRPDSTDTRRFTLYELAQRDRNLAQFVRAVDRTGLADELRRGGPFTVFAPSNAAFARSGFRLDTLLSPAYTDSLRRVLHLHMVRGRVGTYAFPDTMGVGTLFDQPLTLRHPEGKPLTVNRHPARGMTEAQNGLLYVIDAVLTVPKPDTSQTDSLAADSARATPAPARPAPRR